MAMIRIASGRCVCRRDMSHNSAQQRNYVTSNLDFFPTSGFTVANLQEFHGSSAVAEDVLGGVVQLHIMPAPRQSGALPNGSAVGSTNRKGGLTI